MSQFNQPDDDPRLGTPSMSNTNTEALRQMLSEPDLNLGEEQQRTLLERFGSHIATVEAASDTNGQRKVWLELKKGEGLYTNANHCREVHVDYIDERLASLPKKGKTE